MGGRVRGVRGGLQEAFVRSTWLEMERSGISARSIKEESRFDRLLIEKSLTVLGFCTLIKGMLSYRRSHMTGIHDTKTRISDLTILKISDFQ